MKLAAPILLFVFLWSPLYDQDLSGQWNGTLSVQGAQFRIVFHVIKTDNQYKATMDSPDQYASGIPVTTTNFNFPNVKFEISPMGMIYEGTLSDDQITGKWMQAGQSFSLVLERDIPK